MGAGTADDVPLRAVEALRRRGVTRVMAPDLDAEVSALLGVDVDPLDEGACPSDAVIVAPDAVALRLARRFPDAETVPDRTALRDRAIGAGVARLAHVGATLRAECPWDREQVPLTIVPHTVEEAFEVAEAFRGDDTAHQADEIGDLLFQAVFLARFLEEAGAADLGTIADGQADKLISRHPHVYGDTVARAAADVVGLWERQKRESRGGEIFHEVPVGLSALAYGAKVYKRAAAVGFVFPDVASALEKLEEEVEELREDPSANEVGDVIFAAVAVARALQTDAELAVRHSADVFRQRVTRAAELATARGDRFEDLSLDAQLRDYLAAKREIENAD